MPQSQTVSAESGATPTAVQLRPTPMQALLVIIGVVVVIAGYILLATALHIRESYVGFLFVFYWMSFDRGSAKTLPAVVIGAAFGLGCGWLLQFAQQSPQATLLLAVFLALVLVSIYGLVLGWLPYVFNLPAMMMMTVSTIPHIQQHASFPDIFVALAFAVVFFAALVLGIPRLAGMFRKK